MNTFVSGPKPHYYGKGDVTAYRLNRDRDAEGARRVFGANVRLLVYGDAFWSTYSRGDNTGLIATDSMKNFIQRETMNFEGDALEEYCRFLATKFLARYDQVEGLQVTASEVPFDVAGADVAFTPGGPERAQAVLEMNRHDIVDVASGITGFRLLRTGGSSFYGFVRDEYTTLPDLMNRPLHMWLDVQWQYVSATAAFSDGRVAREARRTVRDVFATFECRSIQQMIFTMGSQLLSRLPSLAEVRLEANNRTWDTIAERGDSLGVYTDARPPYGCLGLNLKREG